MTTTQAQPSDGLRTTFRVRGRLRIDGITAIPVLGLLLFVVFVFSLGIGAVAIHPDQVVAILMKRVLGLNLGVDFTMQQELVLWNIRLPRVLLGVLAGSAMAVAGASLQGIFRNPLADPGIIGTSSGGALGAVAIIMLGTAPLGSTYSLPVAAFGGALLLTGFVYLMARQGGRTEVVTLILTGVALSAIANAAIGLMIFYATDAQLRSIVFWTMGGLGGTTWRVVYATAPFVVIGLVMLVRTGRALDLMTLGEREAFHLGVSTERLRIRVIVFAALVSGATVAATGLVGFVGLMVPHLLRLLIGPGHRALLPACVLGGATLMLAADLIARMALNPLEIPLGIVTALIGAPYFLWLLRRTRFAQGGWG